MRNCSRIIRSLIVLNAMVGCTHAFSSLPAASIIVPVRRPFTALSAADNSDWWDKEAKKGWYEQQVEQAQKEIKTEKWGTSESDTADIDRNKYDDQAAQRQRSSTTTSRSSTINPFRSREKGNDARFKSGPSTPIRQKLSDQQTPFYGIEQDQQDTAMQQYDQQFKQQQQISDASNMDNTIMQQNDQRINQRSSDQQYDQLATEQQQEIEVAETTTLNSMEAKVLEAFSYGLSAVAGGVVGFFAVLPVTAYHYLIYAEQTYTTYAQWEWDLVAAVIQGALFATIYRYTLRENIESEKLKSRVLWAFVIVKSLVRIEVPLECAAGDNSLPLYCAEPFDIDFANPIAAELTLNFVESIFLFGIVAAVMNRLLQRKYVRQYTAEGEPSSAPPVDVD